MTYEEFLKFVPAKCMYETIYEDTEGRPILVISLLNAYGMVNKAQRPWQGLTDEEILSISADCAATHQHMDIQFARAIEAKLRRRTHD